MCEPSAVCFMKNGRRKARRIRHIFYVQLFSRGECSSKGCIQMQIERRENASLFSIPCDLGTVHRRVIIFDLIQIFEYFLLKQFEIEIDGLRLLDKWLYIDENLIYWTQIDKKWAAATSSAHANWSSILQFDYYDWSI